MAKYTKAQVQAALRYGGLSEEAFRRVAERMGVKGAHSLPLEKLAEICAVPGGAADRAQFILGMGGKSKKKGWWR